MTADSKNFYLAIGLSCLVIVGWSYFFAPKPNGARVAEIQRQAQTAPQATPGETTSAGAPVALPRDLSVPEAAAPKTRAEALAASPRVKIDTPALSGSLALKGARLDDVALKFYHETTDPTSPNIVLFSPVGAPDAYYAEAGFLAASGEQLALPRADTLWQADRDALTPQTPVTLSFDNGQGLVFHRQIAVDDRYMFTIKDSVENKSDKAVTLAPYALVARQGLPKTANYAVLHEGFIGVIGDGGVEEIKYDKIEKEDGAAKSLSGVGGWLGFTDKYWAATVIPDQKAHDRGALFGRALAVRPEKLSRRFRRRRADAGAGRLDRRPEPRLRRRQGGRDAGSLSDRSRHQEIRSSDRLGLVLFHYPADVPPACISFIA